MNTLLKREFLPTDDKSGRKRWFATLSCQICCRIFVAREFSDRKFIEKPCETCSRRILAYKQFLLKASKKHQDRFDYTLITEDSYVNLFTTVAIVCRTHGVFLQKPKDHVNSTNAKQCCPTCIYEFNKVHNKRSIESWKQELTDKHSHIQFVSHGNADSNTEKCTLVCTDHGKFETNLAQIKNCAYLCPMCAQDHNSWGGRFRRTDVKGYLYFIFIPSLGLWKLGVTSTTVEKRLRNLKLDYELLWIHEFDTLADAYKVETSLFKQFKLFRRPHTEPRLLGKCKGDTELMKCHIPVTAIHKSDLVSKEP